MEPLPIPSEKQPASGGFYATLTIPELEQTSCGPG